MAETRFRLEPEDAKTVEGETPPYSHVCAGGSQVPSAVRSSMGIRVLLCDDQLLIPEGFRKLLEADGGMEVVGEVDDVDLLLPACRKLFPDVVVTETRLKDVEIGSRLLR